MGVVSLLLQNRLHPPPLSVCSYDQRGLEAYTQEQRLKSILHQKKRKMYKLTSRVDKHYSRENTLLV